MIDRRLLLAGLGGIAVGTATRNALAAPDPDPGDRRELLTTIARMRGATDERLVIGYVIGMRYAVPEHTAVPMMGILGATFSQYRRSGEDAFEARTLEVAFFTDTDTGRMLERWKNPVTGRVVDVPRTRMGPSRITLTADGLEVERPAGAAAGLELRHRFLPPVTVGEHVWITEDIRVDGGGDPQPFVYNEFTTYHARRADLADAALAAVPTEVSYQSLITYRPWMGFGDAPGHTIARGAGARAARMEDLPPYYLELLRRHHPDVADDPLGALTQAQRRG